MIEAAGVNDSDHVFMIDIGPNMQEVFIDREENGAVEIGDHQILVTEKPEGSSNDHSYNDLV